MRTKALALLVVIAMLLSLAACTASPTPVATPAPATDAPAETDTPATEAPAAQEVTTYTYLNCWNGGAAGWPDGWENGSIAKAFTAKTGVTLKVETITSSEREKLATVFASGDLPDITNAPHWSTNPGGEGELIKNAAVEGLLLPLKDLIPKYPNLKRLYEVGVISQVYLDRDINHPDYKGEIYVIPFQTGRGKEDVRDWAYNLFARKDILASLNIKPESVTTSEAIYDLLTKIKNGNFTDINGKPVIPGGTWHNGWDYGCFLRGFNNGGVTGWVKDANGKLVNEIFTQLQVDRVLFMRKLVAEGLMDPECFTQTDTMGKEKHITGRVAVFGCHYPHEYGFFKGTLYKTNPEMEFVPLGPILDQKGGVPSQVERIGRTGTPVFFFSKEIQNVDKVLAALDFVNSDEGLPMAWFGLEGVHWNYKDGIPVATEEWTKIKTEDSVKWNLEGPGMASLCLGADPGIGLGWDPDYSSEGYKKAREVNPLKFIDYKTADDVVNTWEGKAAYDEKMATTNWGDELKKAFAAKSDEEAIAIIDAQRQRMKAAGYDEMEAFLNAEYAKDPKILN